MRSGLVPDEEEFVINLTSEGFRNYWQLGKDRVAAGSPLAIGRALDTYSLITGEAGRGSTSTKMPGLPHIARARVKHGVAFLTAVSNFSSDIFLQVT